MNILVACEQSGIGKHQSYKVKQDSKQEVRHFKVLQMLWQINGDNNMELKQIKHHIDSGTYIIVKEDRWEVYTQSLLSDRYNQVTTIDNRSITRLIALQSILNDQET